MSKCFFNTYIRELLGLVVGCVVGLNSHDAELGNGGVEQARRKFKREFKLCASSYKKFKHTVLFVNIIDKVFIMPNIEQCVWIVYMMMQISQIIY